MAAFNRIIIVGNLTRDPEYRTLPSGQGVCRLGLATNRQFKNKQSGNLVQEVCYIDVDVWGAQAESCRQYLQKGRPVLIEGRLKLDSWDDQAGQKRSKHSIVAERVVFLSNGTPAETAFGPSLADDADTGVQLNPNNAVERDLLAQLEKAQTRVKASKASKKEEAPSPSTGEIDFQDEPPFEDNLPF
ncbi:MAG TPA: single-stranded DNA-binding protein [Candidatus Babeliales bacterium]|nr:single-stranded DNA-binding protein [Candidatus Babeliales bacterium]